jgi:hypothetical protein|tara:strand:+ start:321 stop:536 length:216 start_codon:yes stop_codon:yes gene_type:complete
MNSLFVLLILTSQGVYEAQSFDTMRQCLETSSQLKKAETLCIERKPIDPEAEMKRMFKVFKNLRDALDKDI